jgi:uncharacterized protein with PIN domain
LQNDVKPFTVRLNFHGDLNFFVGLRTSSASIERYLVEKTSVKDAIESCGVPHPEVDLILVNGEAVGFDYGLQYRAEVEVFPVGVEPTRCEKNRLQIPNWQCFIVNGHLGKLARNLRLLGFDVAYDRQAQDRQLLQVMASENRALLTRDRRLLMHSVVRHGYCPRSQSADAQTIEVMRRFDLFGSMAPFTRCLRCNARLERVAKADVIEKLEPLTKIYYEEFRRCIGCGQIYWAGSHFSKLQKRLEAIRAQSS